MLRPCGDIFFPASEEVANRNRFRQLIVRQKIPGLRWLPACCRTKSTRASLPIRCAAICVEKRLKAAIEDVGPSTLDEELAELDSSNRMWQYRLADHLAAMNRTEKWPIRSPRRHRFGWQWVVPGAIAAVLMVGAALFALWQYRLNSNDALLASAYDQQRLTDLRLYGGDPVQRASPTRGSSSMPRSVELDALQLRVDEHFKKNPNDPYWQQMSGRVLLLGGSPVDALTKFESASALNANLPGIKLDKAAAYFEIGEKTGDKTRYPVAAELYSEVIHDPAERAQRSLAYYNLALCWERYGVNKAAADAYQEALKLEKDPAWRSEIQKNLDRVKNNIQQSEVNGTQHLDLSPAAFLRELQQNPNRAKEEYESYLGEAARAWLPVQESSPEAASALRNLAEIGMIHQDAWLRDMLRSPQNEVLARGNRRSRKSSEGQSTRQSRRSFGSVK